MSESLAERIAGDVTLAIQRGLLAPGSRVPSQADLMGIYGVAMATAASALAKLSAAGLTRAERGRGTFVVDPARSGGGGSRVLDVMAAAELCRQEASTARRHQRPQLVEADAAAPAATPSTTVAQTPAEPRLSRGAHNWLLPSCTTCVHPYADHSDGNECTSNCRCELYTAKKQVRTPTTTDEHAGRPAGAAVAYWGGHPDHGTVGSDDEHTWPAQEVDMTVLADLDRDLLRWLAHALEAAARAMVATGRQDDGSDRLVAAADAILRRGGRRPAGQPPIAWASEPARARGPLERWLCPDPDPDDPNEPPF